MSNVQSREVLDGLHRVQFTNEEKKLFAYHLLETNRGFILFDTGMDDTPRDHIQPYLEEIGADLEDISLVIITHADADHHGGNASLRDANPDVLLAAHKKDVPLVESVERIMEDRYNQFSEYGIVYPQEIRDVLKGMMGAGEEVDLHLDGGEEIAWTNGTFQVFHAPGHSPGSMVFYDAENDVMIGGDAVYPEGTITRTGEVIQPPPYEDLDAYNKTRSLIQELDPSLLLMSHFKPFEGDAVENFLERSNAWSEGFDDLLSSILEEADQPMSVQEIIDEVVDRKASFGMDLDLAFPIVAHLNEWGVDFEHEDGVAKINLNR